MLHPTSHQLPLNWLLVALRLRHHQVVAVATMMNGGNVNVRGQSKRKYKINQEEKEDTNYVRISPKWYRRIGLLVPRGAEAWYRSYRSDGTGTKVPIYTLSKGAVRTVPQGTPR